MKKLGTKLKDARVRRGYSLDDLQQKTKIQKKYLIALEEERFYEMPSTFYIGTFIQQYADAVGLDSEELLAQWGGEIPIELENGRKGKVSKSSRMEKHGINEDKKSNNKLAIAILCIIVILIASGLTYLTIKERKKNPMINKENDIVLSSDFDTSSSSLESSSTAQTSTESTEDSTTETSEEEVEEMEIELTSETGGDSSFEINLASEEIADKQELTFTVGEGNAWIGVLIGETYAFNETLDPGSETKFELPEGTTNAMVTLGSSKNVKLKLNGELFEFNPNETNVNTRNLYLTFKEKQ